MDMITNYDQEPPMAPMDTSPLEIIPSFLPPMADMITSQGGIAFLMDPSKQDLPPNQTSLHLPLSSEIPMSVFMSSPMEAIDSQLLPQPPPPAANFAHDMRIDPFGMVAQQPGTSEARTHSVSPQQSHVAAPGINGAVNGYPPSLETVLDAGVVIGARSRANTSSLSPPSLPSTFPSISPPAIQGASAVDYPSAGSINNLDESQKVPTAVIGKMLKDIATTAIAAGHAFEKEQGVQQTTKVGELRDRIVQVLDMLQQMSMVNHDVAPVAPPTIPPAFLTEPLEPLPQSGSDLSRKRCASELEEHRTVKALKREPQDDAPLSIIPTEAPPLHPNAFAPPSNQVFPVMTPFGVGPNSRPPSRPPTPPSGYSARTSFNSLSNSASAVAAFPPFASAMAPSHSVPPILPASASAATFPTLSHTPWSDPVVPTRHHHSLSQGSANPSMLSMSTALTNGSLPPSVLAGALSGALSQPATAPPSTSTISPPIGRMSRSGSITGAPYRNSYGTLTYQEAHPEPVNSTWKGKKSTARNGQSNWYLSSEPVHQPTRSSNHTTSAPATAHNSPSDDEDDEEESDSDESTKATNAHTSADRSSTSLATDLPPEYRADVDRIFFEFLNKLCSNLEATCSKGEQIHQTLMAKKMQRLDESPDFRPFKFRILAFTNAFMEELARQGYPEEKIPMKKVRNYLWRQQYILRFNEDGKKAKSKGNHIWNIEAKKAGDGQWEFRPFHRKLAGTPPSVAYSGLKWSWKPHIWDPQVSFKKVHVMYSSPGLPSWLSWKDGELSGIPPPDAESCQITTIAKFSIDNQESQVNHTFSLSIAPVSALDGPPYSRSRRPSFASEQPPKRSTSDSALFQAPQRVGKPRMDDNRVIRVLQNVAQRVTDEAESQFVSASPPQQGELQDLVKQKHVLEQTVDAYDKAISGQGHLQSRRLAVAAQHVVLQAAQTVIADRSVASGVPAPQVESVSMTELTDKTQDAIAMAVKMNGTSSNEVDIIVTATSILKAQTPIIDAPAGVLPTPSRVAVPGVVPRIASVFPPPTSLTTLPEHV